MPSSTSPVPFAFGDHLVRVIRSDDGEPWFVAKDVAEVLGYSNHRDAISKHCKAKGVAFCDTPGGQQEISIIPERDVYRLIFRSRLPAAEQFEEWVVGEVLPSIRKTGGYRKAEVVAAPMQLASASDLPPVAQSLKPQLRATVLNCALQAAKMDNAGAESIMHYFEQFALLVGGKPSAAAAIGNGKYPLAEERVEEFVKTRCTLEDTAATGATVLYEAFHSWHTEKYGRPVPKQKVFGRIMGDYFDRDKGFWDGVSGRCLYRGVTLLA